MKITIAVSLMLIIGLTIYGQSPSPSCATPGAGFLLQIVGHLSTRWNCWLQDSVYSFYKTRGFDDTLATEYAGWAVNQDTANRFDEAMKQLRNANPQYFDQVMTVHGLSFMPAQ